MSSKLFLQVEKQKEWLADHNKERANESIQNLLFKTILKAKKMTRGAVALWHFPLSWLKNDRLNIKHLLLKKTQFWEKKVVDGELDGRIQANLRNKPEILQGKSPVAVRKRQFKTWYKNSQL